MKIRSIDIKGIGGISNLVIDFDDQMNLICGPNGVGKTTVLECVAHSFSASNTRILKRNVLRDSGSFEAVVEIEGEEKHSKIDITEFDPTTNSNITGLHQFAKYLLSLKVTRTFEYQLLNAVSRDNSKNEGQLFQEAMSGVNVQEVKNWFVNRHLYSAHENALTKQQAHNLELAKSCFGLLNEGFEFSKVLASSNEIMVNTPSGEIYYEYLSSGFKSCLSILFGIIKDIEFRFKDPCINADDFDGVILIDELELHLHPEWQSKVPAILTKVFPNVQFIAATHSPHIIQAAKPTEIIALAVDDGNVYRRELNSGKYGFKGWSVEEILIDVMGMTDTRTETYHTTIAEFEAAIAADDYPSAKSSFEQLDELLNESNRLRKLLRLELASVREAEE